MLTKLKLDTSISFRALSKAYPIIQDTLGLLGKAPTYATLINWIHKIGYYELNKIKEKANDWVIILDESIQLGRDKVLVVFGIRESEIDFTRPLNFKDLVPLREITKTNWSGILIRDVIADIENEIGNIIYAVGDYGSDLKRGLSLLKIDHVHDITHKIALILEKFFEKNEAYKEITLKMSEMRNKLSQTEIAFLIPPKQRKKSRYQNIKIISDWCLKVLRFMESSEEKTEKISENLNWILPYKIFIEELGEINKVICDVEKIVKHNGLSALTIEECGLHLSKLTSESGVVLKNELEVYFQETTEMCAGREKILITSDIIESAFGKYKNYVSCNPMAGITNLVLSIAAFTSSLEKEEIKIALETTTKYDIKKWSNEFIGKTLLQKRRETLQPI